MPFVAWVKEVFNKKKKTEDSPETPKRDHSSSGTGGFVPSATSGPLLGMSMAAANTTEGLPTLFIGIVNEHYTEAMWSDCVSRVQPLFNIKPGSFQEIKIPSQKHDPTRIDDELMNDMVHRALDTLNKGNVKFVRLVHMGVGSSIAVFEALEGLLKGWQQDMQYKNIQFVTVGESKDRTNFDFCKWLCLKRLCNRLEFYSTMDYTMMGFVDYDQAH